MLSFPPEFPFVRRPAAPDPEPVAAEPVVEQPRCEQLAPVQAQPERVQPIEASAPEYAPEPEPVPAPPPALIAPPAPQAPRLIERRKFRRDGIATQALVRMDTFHGPPARVTLTDISVAGVRFRSNQPLDMGDKGQIRLEAGPLRWTTRLKVIHCEPDPDGVHTIGCAFLRTELLKPWPATAA